MNIRLKILLVACAAGLLLPGAAAGQTAGAPALVNLSLGSVSSNSGIYAFAISLSNVVAQARPGPHGDRGRRRRRGSTTPSS